MCVTINISICIKHGLIMIIYTVLVSNQDKQGNLKVSSIAVGSRVHVVFPKWLCSDGVSSRKCWTSIENYSKRMEISYEDSSCVQTGWTETLTKERCWSFGYHFLLLKGNYVFPQLIYLDLMLNSLFVPVLYLFSVYECSHSMCL